MPPRASLRAFLATARTALTAPASQRKSPLTFVVGNESADLDSLCSALVFAYLRSHTPPHTLHIPLSNIPREDLVLRPEFTVVLNHANLNPSDVLTLCDLPNGPGALTPEDTRWLLVDHNAITGRLAEAFVGSVVGCIDHHVDENQTPPDTGFEPRVIGKSGSCMSLVVDYCRSAWDALDGSTNPAGDAAEVDARLAKLSLAPILIDTVNLTSKDKTTETDAASVTFLEGKLRAADDYDRKTYFDEVSRIKEDISGLSFRDIFRKDYKEWRQGELLLGIAAAPQNFEYLLEKAGGEMEGGKETFLAELRKWGEERGVDILTLMTTSHPKGEFRRELLAWALKDGPAVKSLDAFVAGSSKALKLESWAEGNLDGDKEKSEWRRAWRQLDVSSSRKQVAPLIREAMKQRGNF
jgi:exopolyphosphatase